MSRISQMIRERNSVDITQRQHKLEVKEKAQKTWKFLKTSVTDEKKQTFQKTDIKELTLSHGMQFLMKLEHTEVISNVHYNTVTEQYLVLDPLGVHVYERNGNKLGCVVTEEELSHVVYCIDFNQYIGWNINSSQIMVYTALFDLISVAKAADPIHSVVYNNETGEIVTGGPGNITVWCLRYGARHLIPRITIRENLTKDDIFNQLVLEGTKSKNQRCFSVCKTGVAVFNMYYGELLIYMKHLHTRVITSVLFFNPLKSLITGSKDGSIKVWDESWQLKLVFVGHSDPVTSLAIYPYGPYIISASDDCTIRVWSLETCDEVDRVVVDDPVKDVGTVYNQDCLFSHGKTHVSLWKVIDMHTLFTAIGETVMTVKHTEHPKMPVRSVCVCDDGTVRVICPSNGKVLTSLVLDNDCSIRDVAYASAEETMFTVLKNGSIIKSDTSTNPSTIMKQWSAGREGSEHVLCLCLYEYINTTVDDMSWLGMMKTIKSGFLETSLSTGTLPSKPTHRTLLLGGRRDGFISVINWQTGRTEFKILAHELGSVTSIISNMIMDQVISAGSDKVIKVWRMFPFANESLAPLMSFFCSHTPKHLSVLKTKLFVAFQDSASATYNTVIYNIGDRIRFDHSPDEDHQDKITSVSCCRRMRLFVTAGLDETLRIWDDCNNLIRLITLNSVPHSVDFSSERGDIIIGVGSHLHRIQYNKYMPKDLLLRQVSMMFPSPPDEKPLPYTDNLINTMDTSDIRRLKAAHSSQLQFVHYTDIIPDQELDEINREIQKKKEMFDLLKVRDEELVDIRDGNMATTIKIEPSPTTKQRALNHFISIFYKKPTITIPDRDSLDEDEQSVTTTDNVTETGYREEIEPTGFFPRVMPRSRCEREDEPMPIKSHGCIPNSIILKLLFPPAALDKMAEDNFILPKFTDEQLAEMARLKKKVEPEEEVPLTPEPVERESSLMQRLQDALMKSVSPTPEPSPEPEPREPSPPPPPTPEPKRESPKPKKIRKPKKFVKFAPEKPMVSPVALPTPPPPKTRTPSPPPRPETPLPGFITQFKDTDWFKKFFSTLNEKTLPKPWTAVNFVRMLLRLVKIADYDMKTPIIQSIHLLHDQEPLNNSSEEIELTLMYIFNHSNPPSTHESVQRKYIFSALKLLQALQMNSLDFVLELMFDYLEGEVTTRFLIQEIISSLGVQDPHKFFFKEMDDWDIYEFNDDPERKPKIKKMCREWLDEWMGKFKEHLKHSIKELKKGKIQVSNSRRTTAGQGRSKQPSKQQSKQQSKKSTVPTTPTKPPSSADTNIVGGDLEGLISRPDSNRSGRSGSSDIRSGKNVSFSDRGSTPGEPVTVLLDKLPDDSVVDTVKPTEVISYFVELQLDEYLKQMRGEITRPQVKDIAKKTVLVLPKLPMRTSLVRLGETHTSQCKAFRETSYTDKHRPLGIPRQSDIGGGGVNHINLPMKTMYMNPFPSKYDYYQFINNQQPVLLMLKTAQKYFIPSDSYIETY